MGNTHILNVIRYLPIVGALFCMGCACGGYKGDCFDVTINGVDVIPLTSEKLTAPFEKVSYDVRDAQWQVREPVDRTIDVRFSVETPDGKQWIGADPAMEVIVIPLENQNLNSDYSLTGTNNVRVEGRPLITMSKVLKSNILPPGNYLFKVSLRGGNNWDRKTIFVIVK